MTINIILIDNDDIDLCNSDLCEIQEAEQLKQLPTLGRLFDELYRKLQIEQKKNPDSPATKEFQKNLEKLEKEYKDEIPKIIEDYQKEYTNFIRDKLPKAEENYRKLVNWTDESENPGAKLRKAIKRLRYKSYEQVQNSLKYEWDCAKNDLKNGKCCREQALALQMKAQSYYESHKKFKEHIANYCKDLDDIYKKAENLIKNSENYRVVYAYRLEFKPILDKLKELKKDETKEQTPCDPDTDTAKDHEWLKSVLTKSLRNWCIATYEYFYWQKNWIKLTEREKITQENYKSFLHTRTDNFIREAQDIGLEDIELDDEEVFEEEIASSTPQPTRAATGAAAGTATGAARPVS